jgi:uncharacterized protein with NRDE domain
MCTLAVALHVAPGTPLAIAANRDEKLDRASLPPSIEPGPPRVLEPRDAVGGGTWLGINQHGLFVGITNRFGAMVDPARRSLGMLVRESLEAPDAETLHAWLAPQPATDYNGFHLVYADVRGAYLTWGDGITLQQRVLGDGLHVFSERSLGASDRCRDPAVREKFEALFVHRADPTLDGLRDVLRWHGPEDDPLGGACVHAPAFNYGTRSSLQVAVRASGEWEASWTEGPPCVTPARVLTSEVRAVVRR